MKIENPIMKIENDDSEMQLQFPKFQSSQNFKPTISFREFTLRFWIDDWIRELDSWILVLVSQFTLTIWFVDFGFENFDFVNLI